jgi:hypothetical protein
VDPPAQPAWVIAAGDGPAACARLRALLTDSDADVIRCDVAALAADGASVDVLARLELTARRAGRRLLLERASPELAELLAFCGLTVALRLQRPVRQAEQGEEAGGVEERVDGDDAVA